MAATRWRFVDPLDRENCRPVRTERGGHCVRGNLNLPAGDLDSADATRTTRGDPANGPRVP
eukprot:1501602-Pyramimonas_sp.AAC.1